MSRITKGKAALAIGLGAVAAGTIALSAGAATSSTSGRNAPAAGADSSVKAREDFNGDGFNDLAVSAPKGGKGGYVSVVYGSAKGLDTSTRTQIDQNTPGVPGKPKKRNSFGVEIFPGDYDDDGVADLAVLNPGEWTVTVLWGAKGKRLSGDGAATIEWATSAATGDFNGDGKQDLMRMSDPREATSSAVLYGPLTRAGKPAASKDVVLTEGNGEPVSLTPGDVTGDGKDDLFVTEVDMEDSGTALPGVLFVGTADDGLQRRRVDLPLSRGGAIGDFDDDGHGDLALLPLPGGDSDKVKVMYGDSKGLSKRSVDLSQATDGVPGAHEKGDRFGTSLAAGDADGDGDDDLAVGVPGATVSGKTGAGRTVLLKGGKSGLPGTGAQAFDQDDTSVPSDAEKGDLFGTNLRLLDFDDDGKADLADSAAGENAFSGAVWAFPGSESGLDMKGVSFAPDDLGAPAANAEFGAAFGSSTPYWLQDVRTG